MELKAFPKHFQLSVCSKKIGKQNSAFWCLNLSHPLNLHMTAWMQGGSQLPFHSSNFPTSEGGMSSNWSKYPPYWYYVPSLLHLSVDVSFGGAVCCLLDYTGLVWLIFKKRIDKCIQNFLCNCCHSFLNTRHSLLTSIIRYLNWQFHVYGCKHPAVIYSLNMVGVIWLSLSAYSPSHMLCMIDLRVLLISFGFTKFDALSRAIVIFWLSRNYLNLFRIEVQTVERSRGDLQKSVWLDGAM